MTAIIPQGNADADSLVGAAGSDTIFGGQGDDNIQLGGTGANTESAATTVQYGHGNLGNDSVTAADSSGTNTLLGGQGNDTVVGGVGADFLNGNLGNDQITVTQTGTPAWRSFWPAAPRWPRCCRHPRTP